MNKNFILSEKLKLFLQVACNYKAITLGEKLPVSIRRRHTYSQSIFIYPESDYNFITINEAIYFLSLAKNLDLYAFVETENGVPVIKITDYSLND